VLAVVARDGAVRGLGLDGLAFGVINTEVIRPSEPKPCATDVRLHVAVVVLAGPDEAARPLQRRGHEVVDQPVLVDDALGLELVGELGVEDLLEQVLEAAVVGLEDRVLGRKIDRPAKVQAVVEDARANSRIDSSRLYIPMATPAPRGLEHLALDGLPVSPTNRIVSVPLPGKWKSVARYWSPKAWRPTTMGCVQPGRGGDVPGDDRLAEDHAAQDVADRPVRGLPHLLEPNSSTRCSSGVIVAHFTPRRAA
jgi:hypothetical protein